jgi:dolichyl-phosphate-mannose--protein O-mannosyl transferase
LSFFDFFIKGSIENPLTRLYNMISGTAINDFTVPKLSISSRPWTWIYPQFVQFYYNSPNVPFIIYSYDPQYVSFVSTTVQILIIPTLGYLLFKAGEGSKLAIFLLLWFVATYVVWIPLDIASNRVTFVFYFLPTIPVFCIGVAMGINEAIDRIRAHVQKLGKVTVGSEIAYAGIGMFLFLHFLIFVMFNPAMITIVKTWESPFSIGVDPTPGAVSLLLFSTSPATKWLQALKSKLFK